jgi:hypothetical protein
LTRAVFHGQHGEVRQRYREGQEDQLGALGLVVNVIVLWNTLYMDAALDHLQAQGVAIDPLDMARLSPLGHRNINLLGRYSFALADPIKSGQLRPLRDPWRSGGWPTFAVHQRPRKIKHPKEADSHPRPQSHPLSRLLTRDTRVTILSIARDL